MKKKQKSHGVKITTLPNYSCPSPTDPLPLNMTNKRNELVLSNHTGRNTRTQRPTEEETKRNRGLLVLDHYTTARVDLPDKTDTESS